MATARLIVNLALRKLGVVGSGREPRNSDQTDTLAALEGMYALWIAAGAFGRLSDVVPTGTQYTARGNERIYRMGANPIEVTLPTLISDERLADYGRDQRGYYGTVITVDTVDGDTIVTVEPGQPMGCVIPPRDGAPVIITSEDTGNSASWLYDGTTKRWDRLDMLQLDQEAPRSVDAHGIASCLAIEVSDQFGVDPPAATIMAAARFKQAMTQRYGMRREETIGVFC